MSKTYKAADKLRKDILYAAERFFKEYGYDKTTYQMLSDELGVSKSAISYHFKTKGRLLFIMFENYMKNGYAYLRERMTEDFNYYSYHCAAHIIFYRKIMGRRRNWELFFHKDNLDIWENEKISLVEKYFKEISGDFRKDFTDVEIHMTAVMNLGAKVALMKEFIRNPGRAAIDDYCFHLVYMIGRMSKLDEATIMKNVERAFDFADRHMSVFGDWLE